MEPEIYMEMALELAREAAQAGETPVGCVITDPAGRVIGRGRNRTEEKDATCHAEIEAIRDASGNLGSWRLEGCSLYVTMEPCPMCAGAVMMSRISRVFYGAKDAAAGSCGSVINLFMEDYGRRVQVVGGVLQEPCAKILGEFFQNLRRRGQPPM